MKVLAVIPAFNEEDCLVDTIAELERCAPHVDYLVVNDGSSDHTADIIKHNHLRGINLPINTGLASAFRAGMKYAWRSGYDAVIQFDADGQHVPTYIEPMAEEMERSGADIVIASRVLAGGGPVGARAAGSKLITWLIKATTGATITDPTSGMRMYNRHMMHYFVYGFDVAPEPDTVALIARKGGTVREVPCEMRERQGGESYLKLGNVIRYMSRTCLSILLFQWLR
ncbi:MAG: glycosyltransferase family 2 protein [Atopobiaceae bacterium]|jgi:glycosyltransferase involved in cell wall biosynthesis